MTPKKPGGIQPTNKLGKGYYDTLSDAEVDRILGIRPDGWVCARNSHYASSTLEHGRLTHDPRLHDPEDGEPCELVEP